MNADKEHRKRSPNCEYIFHRDAGCFMEICTYRDGENGMGKPWQCCKKHTFRPTASRAPEPVSTLVAAKNDVVPTFCDSVKDVADDLMFIDDECYEDYDACLSNDMS